jgi:hypothetical protein
LILYQVQCQLLDLKLRERFLAGDLLVWQLHGWLRFAEEVQQFDLVLTVNWTSQVVLDSRALMIVPELSVHY